MNPTLKARATSEKRIDGPGVWSQAFRVYHSVFSYFKPQRSAELIQHKHNIMGAAKSFPWVNVYSYDKKFRRHMQKYPERKWGKLHQNLYLAELNKKHEKKQLGGNEAGLPRNKIPCRRFNGKNDCPFNEKCFYNHRCSVCGQRGHGASTCWKKINKDNKNKNKREQGNLPARTAVSNNNA